MNSPMEYSIDEVRTIFGDTSQSNNSHHGGTYAADIFIAPLELMGPLLFLRLIAGQSVLMWSTTESVSYFYLILFYLFTDILHYKFSPLLFLQFYLSKWKSSPKLYFPVSFASRLLCDYIRILAGVSLLRHDFERPKGELSVCFSGVAHN